MKKLFTLLTILGAINFSVAQESTSDIAIDTVKNTVISSSSVEVKSNKLNDTLVKIDPTKKVVDKVVDDEQIKALEKANKIKEREAKIVAKRIKRAEKAKIKKENLLKSIEAKEETIAKLKVQLDKQKSKYEKKKNMLSPVKLKKRELKIEKLKEKISKKRGKLNKLMMK